MRADNWRKNLSHTKIQNNYSKRTFTQRAMAIQIIRDPDNQSPDEWSSAVQKVINVTLRKVDTDEM